MPTWGLFLAVAKREATMPDWLINIPADFWVVLSEMAPYLLFGFFIAGVLSVLISPQAVERHLGGPGIWPIIKSAAFGVPLPLCSCGVIPVAASLRRHGASKAATISFLIATPQDGVDSVMVTYGLLGGVFALFRPIFALVTGVVAGSVVSVADKGDGPAAQAGTAELVCRRKAHSRARQAMQYGFDHLPRDIGRALLIGLVVAATISAVVPRNYFADVLPPGILQMLLLMLVAIPIYVCATASVPLAYAMILAGVSPGAAFAFLMTGPATNAATIATIWKVMGKRTTIIYLATMIAGALVGGALLDQLVTGPQAVPGGAVGWMLPPSVKHVSGVVLLAVLANAIVRPWLKRFTDKSRPGDEALRLKVTGMTCTHCAAGVRRALLECAGVEDVQVDLDDGSASIWGQAVDSEALVAAVKEIGYEAERANDPVSGNVEQ